MFCGAARSPCPDGIQADGGSATGALVHFEHLPEGKGAHLRGAAVGDAAVRSHHHQSTLNEEIVAGDYRPTQYRPSSPIKHCETNRRVSAWSCFAS